MGGGFMENIFDCNEEKMQIFPTFCKNFILAQILALGFGLTSGFSQISSLRRQINKVRQGFYILVPDEGPRSQLQTINRE